MGDRVRDAGNGRRKTILGIQEARVEEHDMPWIGGCRKNVAIRFTISVPGDRDTLTPTSIALVNYLNVRGDDLRTQWYHVSRNPKHARPETNVKKTQVQGFAEA